MSKNHDDQGIVDFATINGDAIMAEAARERMANGDWSQENLDWLWDECRRRLDRSSPVARQRRSGLSPTKARNALLPPQIGKHI